MEWDRRCGAGAGLSGGQNFKSDKSHHFVVPAEGDEILRRVILARPSMKAASGLAISELAFGTRVNGGRVECCCYM